MEVSNNKQHYESIQFCHEELLHKIAYRYDNKDIERIDKALKFAKEKLEGKIRETGEPTYLHILRVALIIMDEINLGATAVIAAILHEILDHGNTDEKLLEREFGKQVTSIINGVIKINQLQTEKLSLNSENYISLLLTITDDVRIILLKLADTLDKIRKIKSYNPERQLKIAQETRLLYGPIAHRLGLYHIKTELEDISLRHIEPEIYFEIARKLKDTKRQREQYIAEFNDSINEALKTKGYDYEIKGRPKSVNSIYGKIKQQGIDVSEIYDLFAIRVILNNVPLEKEKEECWNVYSIVTNIYQPNPTRLRDWITTPRPSGYESLHTTVIGPGGHWVEVQIRTRRMDEIAEKGDAAHWKYKESEAGKAETHDAWLRSIRDTLELKNPDALDDIQLAKQSPKSSEIFVFTPQGDIIKLRDGSTILDFAYSIHSNLGNTCTGAKVNEKIVTIKHKLKNGDTVEVITSKNQRPKPEWLNIAISPRIKARIRRSINEDLFKQAEVGKEILERKISQMKLDFNDQVILKMINHFKYKHALDFYQDIADEKLDVQLVREFLQALKSEDEPKTSEVTELSAGDYVQQSSPSEGYLIIDKDLVDVDFKLAKCCRPIPGDTIFGFVTVDRGIQIHRKGCPNAKDLFTRFPYRIVQARWNDESKSSSFLAEIVVTGVDKIGVVNHISEVIAKSNNVNLRSLAVNSKDGIFQSFITVFINSASHLDTLLANINKVKGVLRAERLDKGVV